MTSDAAPAPGALRWLILGEWRAYPGRVVTAAMAIAVGVALGFAVHLINTSALSEFSKAIGAVNGAADLQVAAVGPAGFPESLYPAIARTPGVAVASPVVQLNATLDRGERRTFNLLGIDLFRAAAATPSLIGKPFETGGAGAFGGGAAVFDENAIFLSQALIDEAKLQPGDTVMVTAAGRTVPVTVAGSLPGAPEGQRLAVLDIAAAQWRFGQLGRLHRLDLKLAPGADPTAVAKVVAARLPTGAELTDPDRQAQRGDALSRAYRVNLNMLALVALLTGGFLVFSAQSLSVARRRSQFALLRVLGTSRRALLIQVLTEGAIVGAVGAGLGLALGLGLADLALSTLGGDLGSGYFQGGRPALAFAPIAAGLFFALGLACALAGSLLPAREAAEAEPAVALKAAGDAIDPRQKPSPRLALVLLALGAAFAFGPPILGLPLLAYASMALLLAGGVALMPWLSRALLTPLQRLNLTSPTLQLAVGRLWGAPSQAAVALCGIVASTSLMIAMAVMVSSFRGSVDDWLTAVMPDDLYLRFEGAADGIGLDPAAQAALRAVPGVAKVRFTRFQSIRLASDQPPVALVAQENARTLPGAGLPAIGRDRTLPAGMIPVWPTEPAAYIYGLKPGTTATLPIAGGTKVFVVNVWRDYARQTGAIVLDSKDYDRLTGDTLRTEAGFVLKPGAAPQKVTADLRAALPPPLAKRAWFAQPSEIRNLALGLFDRSFAITYLLEAIAILVGLAGVAATVSAQTLARTKEFGMLRHIGVLRRQIVAMLCAEGALLGVVGGAAGIALGLVMSQVLIHVVNPQSFHWTMKTQLPWGLFIVVAAALVAASAGTALLAGRRAVSVDAVRAVREDW